MYRIRVRLMIAILLAALLPAVPMSLVVGDLLERSMNRSLQTELVAGLEAGLDVSREDLARRKADFLAAARRAAREELRPSPRSAGPLIVLDLDGRPAPLTPEANRLGRGDHLDETPRLVNGHLAVQLEGPEGSEGVPVIVAQRLPAEIAARAGEITEALSLLAAYEHERESILRSYVLPFLIVYGALIVAALAIAAVVSNRLARPLEDVAHAASRVADGDFDTRVQGAPRGEVGDLVQAFNDMVERLQRQRAELGRLEKLSAWRDMARVLAHEIKNPLTPILLAVQQARISYDGADEQHAEVLADCEAIVSEEVDGLRQLVRSFSDFARPPRPEIKPADVGEVLDSLQRLYGERLEVAHDAAMRAWPLDAAQIKRVLINLIDNGLTACERAGNEPSVAVETTDFGDQLQFLVRDRGAGIAPEDQRRIFEPDFTTSSSGMGLGLPTALGTVEAHGGTIRVATGPTGTDMTVALPWRDDEETS